MTEPVFRNNPSGAPATAAKAELSAEVGEKCTVDDIGPRPASAHSEDPSPLLPASDPSPNIHPEAEQAAGPEMFPKLGILDKLQAAQTATLETFQREIATAAGRWAAEHVPRVCQALQAGESVRLDDELLSRLGETRAFWKGAEGRIAECERCQAPESDPACLGSDFGVSPGVVVRLQIAGSDLPHPTIYRKLTPCSRFQEDRLNRRLRASGVPQRLATTRLTRIDNPESLEPARRAFDDVLSRLREQKEFTLLIQGKLCREYGAALLAECAFSSACSMASVHVPTFVRGERIAMASKSNYGLMPYAQVHVLVLDDIESAQFESKHWLDEILWMQSSRRDSGLITILTTPLLKPTLKDTFPGARRLTVEKNK